MSFRSWANSSSASSCRNCSQAREKLETTLKFNDSTAFQVASCQEGEVWNEKENIKNKRKICTRVKKRIFSRQSTYSGWSGHSRGECIFMPIMARGTMNMEQFPWRSDIDFAFSHNHQHHHDRVLRECILQHLVQGNSADAADYSITNFQLSDADYLRLFEYWRLLIKQRPFLKRTKAKFDHRHISGVRFGFSQVWVVPSTQMQRHTTVADNMAL